MFDIVVDCWSTAVQLSTNFLWSTLLLLKSSLLSAQPQFEHTFVSHLVSTLFLLKCTLGTTGFSKQQIEHTCHFHLVSTLFLLKSSLLLAQLGFASNKLSTHYFCVESNFFHLSFVECQSAASFDTTRFKECRCENVSNWTCDFFCCCMMVCRGSPDFRLLFYSGCFILACCCLHGNRFGDLR